MNGREVMGMIRKFCQQNNIVCDNMLASLEMVMFNILRFAQRNGYHWSLRSNHLPGEQAYGLDITGIELNRKIEVRTTAALPEVAVMRGVIKFIEAWQEQNDLIDHAQPKSRPTKKKPYTVQAFEISIPEAGTPGERSERLQQAVADFIRSMMDRLPSNQR